MSNNLNSLLQRVAKSDAALAVELRLEMDHLAKRREFGLNFEKHRPETVELHGRLVRVGTKVRFLPPRGSTAPVRRDTWLVQSVEGQAPDATASLIIENGKETARRAVQDLVVVADFRDPIYPGLTSTGAVEQGGDKPFHAVINSENYHALEAMLFTWHGSVDAMYIDPPYNTRDKDWKYNNDYVDNDDDYKHSKWLSFMERRLKLAKKLLNPVNSVLIVTIDEKEYLRLGLLLQQVFTGVPVQMVTTVISPSGQPRGNQMSRVDEYIFFVYIGSASASGGIDDMLGNRDEAPADEDAEEAPTTTPVQWESLVRRGTSARRVDREKQFFPFFINPQTRQIVGVGEPLLPPTVSRDTVEVPNGLVAVWPLRSDGSEGRWRVSKEGVEALLKRGFVRVGRLNKERGQWAMNYLLRSDVKRLDAGEITVEGYTEAGAAILSERARTQVKGVVPKTVWNRDSHNAGNHGSALLRTLLPGRSFPFPKSLYAVEDALRIFVASKPEAVIVDFFGGSGTTAHAVARLNRQDGGRRRSIVVTNNEVSDEEAAALRARGLRPGDPDWEVLGICEHITKPRIRAAITGVTPDGQPLKGDYKFRDTFPMS